MRVMLMLEATQEHLCIVTGASSTIADLKAQVFHALQFYSIYQEYLQFCTIHLELNINGSLYPFHENYALKDCMEPNDVWTVRFIENKHFQNRKSIYMKSQTKSDIQNRCQKQINSTNKRQKAPQASSVRISRPQIESKSNDANHVRVIPVGDTSEIKQWIQNYVSTNSTLHAIYNTEYKLFVHKLRERYPRLNQILGTKYSSDLSAFLIQECALSVLHTKTGRIMQRETVKTQSKNKKNKNKLPYVQQPIAAKNKNTKNNAILAANPVLQGATCAVPKDSAAAVINKKKMNNVNHKPQTQPKAPVIPQVEHKQIEIEASVSNVVDAKRNETKIVLKPIDTEAKQSVKSIEELPITPDSPSDEEEEHEEHQETEDYVEEATPKEAPQTIESQSHTNEESPAVDKSNSNESISELLPEIVEKCYDKLVTDHKGCKYVELNELERSVKNAFRDNTPYELDLAELNYVNFNQLLSIEMKSVFDDIAIVSIYKHLISKEKKESDSAKDSETEKDKDKDKKCPDIGSYVVIDSGNKEEEEQKQEENEAIVDNIRYLKQCNVIKKMNARDVYYHIKVMHSECPMHMIEKELNGYVNAGYHHRVAQYKDTFEEVASVLQQNNITGARLLEMRWSDWEMLHELDRYDSEHQDFVEDIINDFFFPFITGQELATHITICQKYSTRETIFHNEDIRRNFTLCVDYGLFCEQAPILHGFIKKAELDDCTRLIKLHNHLSVDVVMGSYSSMHIAAWRGKFRLLANFCRYGGDPLKKNKQGETAFQAGKKHGQKLKWFYSQFPQYKET